MLNFIIKFIKKDDIFINGVSFKLNDKFYFEIPYICQRTKCLVNFGKIKKISNTLITLELFNEYREVYTIKELSLLMIKINFEAIIKSHEELGIYGNLPNYKDIYNSITKGIKI